MVLSPNPPAPLLRPPCAIRNTAGRGEAIDPSGLPQHVPQARRPLVLHAEDTRQGPGVDIMGGAV